MPSKIPTSIVLLVVSLCFIENLHAESVVVKYHQSVNIDSFDCEWINKSSLIQRLCYDSLKAYAIVNLSGVYYHYCNVPESIIKSWKSSSSMGKFYNANIKGRYDCRLAKVPKY